MHFVILGHMDPEDEAFWSGIPKNIAQNLRNEGHKVTTIGPLEPNVTLWARLKVRFYRYIPGLVYLINRDPTVARLRAGHARRLLGPCEDVDAVIVVALSDAAYLDCSSRLILVHDATWHQLLDFYPGYELDRLAQETLDGGEEMDRLSLRKCDLAIYASAWAARSAIEDYGAEIEKVRVIPFGAGLHPFPTREQCFARLRRPVQSSPLRLLFVGVDWHRKGGDVAVEIAERIAIRGVQVELQVVGCHPPTELPPMVRCFGFLSKNNLAQKELINRLFSEADFFILPSRAECFGMVFAEAAAYGLPVVATNVGGVKEIVDDSWGLLLSSDLSIDTAADWIITRFLDRDAYKLMANAAREKFERQLNWGTFCRELVRLTLEVRLKQ